jgi:hypothetical protein
MTISPSLLSLQHIGRSLAHPAKTRVHALKHSRSELKLSEFRRTVTTVDVSTWHFVSNIQQRGAMSIAAKKITD